MASWAGNFPRLFGKPRRRPPRSVGMSQQDVLSAPRSVSSLNSGEQCCATLMKALHHTTNSSSWQLRPSWALTHHGVRVIFRSLFRLHEAPRLDSTRLGCPRPTPVLSFSERRRPRWGFGNRTVHYNWITFLIRGHQWSSRTLRSLWEYQQWLMTVDLLAAGWPQ